MQIEAGLKAIEKKRRKTHAQIGKHDTRCTNLFLAYFALRDKTDEGEPPCVRIVVASNFQ